jgi:hypothetical protein
MRASLQLKSTVFQALILQWNTNPACLLPLVMSGHPKIHMAGQEALDPYSPLSTKVSLQLPK